MLGTKSMKTSMLLATTLLSAAPRSSSRVADEDAEPLPALRAQATASWSAGRVEQHRAATWQPGSGATRGTLKGPGGEDTGHP